MRECVIAENVTRIRDLLHKISVGYSLADEKECSLEVELRQSFEYSVRMCWVRAIVEGEKHFSWRS